MGGAGAVSYTHLDVYKRQGMDACLWLSSAGFAAQFVVLLASPVARLRRQPEAVAG